MLADITITSSHVQGFFGWGSLICFGFVILAIIFLTIYKKCDDWWTPMFALVIAYLSGIIGVIFGLIWIGTKI